MEDKINLLIVRAYRMDKNFNKQDLEEFILKEFKVEIDITNRLTNIAKTWNHQTNMPSS